MAETPFDSIESAQEYVRMLAAEVKAVQAGIQDDIGEATRDRAERRLDALQIVDYKLSQLAQHLGASSRILNDLRMLSRLFVSDETVAEISHQSKETANEQHI